MTGLLLAACGQGGASSGLADTVKIVASTTIVGDVVRQVAGEDADLVILIPPGSDPHIFEPRPQDIAALSDADVVFINGLELEEALEPALEANVQGRLVAVSEGIELLPFGDESAQHAQGANQPTQPSEDAEASDAHEHAAGDPHTWMDPNNVIRWAQNIADTLTQVDPQHGDIYQRNAEAYIAELRALDTWIREQVLQIPSANRKLVSDHAVFGYLADEYGFEQVGLVVPSLSTNAAPSARQIADLVDVIQAQNVKAIFVGTTVNPTLSQQVAKDTGVQIVFVYTGSLSQQGEEAGSYLEFMRYNIKAILEALK